MSTTLTNIRSSTIYEVEFRTVDGFEEAIGYTPNGMYFLLRTPTPGEGETSIEVLKGRLFAQLEGNQFIQASRYPENLGQWGIAA